MDFIFIVDGLLADFLFDTREVFNFSDADIINIYNFVHDQLHGALPDWLNQIMAAPIAFVLVVWEVFKNAIGGSISNFTRIVRWVADHAYVPFGGFISAWDFAFNYAYSWFTWLEDNGRLLADFVNRWIASFKTTIQDALDVAQYIWDNGWQLIVNLINSTSSTMWLYVSTAVHSAIDFAIAALDLAFIQAQEVRRLITLLVNQPFAWVQFYFDQILGSAFGGLASDWYNVTYYTLAYKDILFAFLLDPSGYIVASVRDRIYDIIHAWAIDNF